MIIRRESTSDLAAVHRLTVAAFGRDFEAKLLEALRTDPGWIPRLSLVAVESVTQSVAEGVAVAEGGPVESVAEGVAESIVGHVVCTRGWIGHRPALGLGPLSVLPAHQRAGVGSALVHAVVAAADAMDEPVVALVGHLEYYPRFGFRTSTDYGILPPDPAWGLHFMVRTLAAYDGSQRGMFRYAEAFSADG